MIENWRWIVTAVGVFLDVVGAWVIASAVIAGAKRARRGFDTTEAASTTMLEASRAKWGASILTVGFLLQFTGTRPAADRAWPHVAGSQAVVGTPMITDWIIAGLTLIIAVFTFQVWKVYEIAWLTGAMETHSDLLLRIEALRGIIDVCVSNRQLMPRAILSGHATTGKPRGAGATATARD